MTADIQSRRRLGSATLIREDGREGDVFSLIGPQRYDAPWKDMETQGWIAPADCVEIRVTLTGAERLDYATAEPDERYRVASTVATKNRIVERLVAQHAGEQVLVIGQYLEQLDELAARLDAPVIKGETTVRARERLFDAFRPASCAPSSSARSRTSRSTCRRPGSRSRCRGRSGPDRRRRSGWGGCYARGPTAGRPGSTRSARDTLDTE